MNRLLIVIAFLCTVAINAQQPIVEYPYNPDSDSDSLIGYSDLLDFLPYYGSQFISAEILINGVTLTEYLDAIANSIDSLASTNGVISTAASELPIGTVLPIASEEPPSTWVLCDGRELSIEEYSELFNIIGTTFGAGDSAFWSQVNLPATTFNVPDLRGRSVYGADNMGGESSGTLLGHPSVFGSGGGEEYHSLTINEIPEHSHEIEGYLAYNDGGSQSSGNVGLGPPPPIGDQVSLSFQSDSAGGGQAHSNMGPYLVLNFMIKTEVEDGAIVSEAFFSNDGETIVVSPSEALVLSSGQCGTSNSAAGVNCTNLHLELDPSFNEPWPDFFEMKIFNKGTIYSEDETFYGQEVRFILNGNEYTVEPNHLVSLIHLQGEWFIRDDGIIDDN
jgi:microcystin-dependent protein